MTWRYQILDVAQRDFEEIERYLDDVAPEHAGRFIDDFHAAVTRVAMYPMLRAEIRPDVRRESLRIFRFHLWYRVFPDVEYFEIFAILHHARDPRSGDGRR